MGKRKLYYIFIALVLAAASFVIVNSSLSESNPELAVSLLPPSASGQASGNADSSAAGASDSAFGILSQTVEALNAVDKRVADSEPSLVLSAVNCKINVLDRFTLTAAKGEPISWSSGDPSVADVSGGVITAKKAGSTIITANDAEGNSASCEVSVVKTVYLMVNDSPNDDLTPKLLDKLNKHGIKATFFVSSGRDFQRLYNEMANSGHQILPHSYSHNTSTIYKSCDTFEKDYLKEQTFLKKTLGRDDMEKIVCFPGGTEGRASIAKYMAGKGYHIFDWTNSFHDSVYTDSGDCYNYVVKHFSGGDREILLMHHRPASIGALEKVIEFYLDKGYEFATITYDTKPYNFVGQY